MAEFTSWVGARLSQQLDSGSTVWDNLSNAQSDNTNFAQARASNGAWGGSPGRSTYIVSFEGNTDLLAFMPAGSIIDKVECRIYLDLTETLLVIPDLRLRRSSNPNTQVSLEILANIGPAAGPLIVDWDDTISDSEGWAIANGGDVMYFYGTHTLQEADTWSLNMRYCELRLQFTRPPNVPRTAYIAMF